MSLQDNIFDVRDSLTTGEHLKEALELFEEILDYLIEVEEERDILKHQNKAMKEVISIKKKEK